MMDNKAVLYVSVPGELHAITMNDLVTDAESFSINAIAGLEGSAEVLNFGPKTRRGVIRFEADFRCLVMYDTEASFFNENDMNCVIAIFDNSTLLDYN